MTPPGSSHQCHSTYSGLYLVSNSDAQAGQQQSTLGFVLPPSYTQLHLVEMADLVEMAEGLLLCWAHSSTYKVVTPGASKGLQLLPAEHLSVLLSASATPMCKGVPVTSIRALTLRNKSLHHTHLL